VKTYKYIRSYRGRAGTVQETPARDYAEFLEVLESWNRTGLDRFGKPVYSYAAVSQPTAEDMDL
jgi:hypothetical protein